VVILNPRYYIDILLQIKSHIVTGSSWSWWMAISATNTSVPAIYPMGYSQSYIDRSISVSYDWSYSLWFDHVYYINLAKRTDRRQKMEDQLHKWHLHATRIEAVDGATIKWSIANGVSNKYWNNGALGLCLSFNKVLDDAIANGYNKILILEDDAILTDNFVSVLNVAWKALPNEWRMLYLGANHAGNIPTQDISSSLYRLISSFGSHAMILNRTCFQHFRRFLSAPYGPLDVYFSVYHKFYPCYITYPGVAYQDIGFSDILEKNTDYGKNIDYIDWKKQFQHPLQS
jgi:glycosyl transferase family 25